MDKGKIIVIAAAFAVTVFLASALVNAAFAHVTEGMAFRGTDAYGSGAFGSSRDGGARPHQGTDIIAAPGQDVFSPISGTITRMAYPYANSTAYKGVEIKNGSYTVKMFYIAPVVAVGTAVKAGQRIATAQNIAANYPGMQNHVHLEVRDNSGNLLNPANLF